MRSLPPLVPPLQIEFMAEQLTAAQQAADAAAAAEQRAAPGGT